MTICANFHFEGYIIDFHCIAFIYIYMYLYIGVCVCMHARARLFVCVHMRVRLFVCVHVRAYNNDGCNLISYSSVDPVFKYNMDPLCFPYNHKCFQTTYTSIKVFYSLCFQTTFACTLIMMHPCLI